MPEYDQIFENNKKWVADICKKDPHFFEELAKNQTPDYLYIGCSDSRIPANQIMGLKPGEVFVHRNIANLICATDLNVLSVINYAVTQLKVKHIIVCGHYDCGGVAAAMQSKDMGILNPWLRNIRDVYRMYKDELNAIKDPVLRNKRLVELNTLEQSYNVIKLASVQKSYLKNSYPIVHAWVFGLNTGLIKDLEINFEETLKEVQEIYDLTEDGKSLE
ncbi:MAG TPA: carbonic anhydrase [Chitinophagaceae bacterium]|nr:carbonic anhydrase [Chitinophagaceae bacterium]